MRRGYIKRWDLILLNYQIAAKIEILRLLRDLYVLTDEMESRGELGKLDAQDTKGK